MSELILPNNGNSNGIGWSGEVDVYGDLPSPDSVTGEVWLVKNDSGVWPLKKKAGLYRSTGGSWKYLGVATLSSLGDVDVTSITDGQGIKYSENDGGYIPETFTKEADFQSHIGDTNNPHSVTAEQLGAQNILDQVKTVDGEGSELDADMLDGKHADNFATASGLNNHVSDTNNPHQVTINQIGAAPASHTHPLSDIEQSGAIKGQVPVWDGNNWTPGNKYVGGTRTITIPAGSTTTQIQDILNNADHYIPPGTYVYIQFEDGTYTIDSSIYISHWYGGGFLYLQGNPSDNTAVTLDASGATAAFPTLFILNNSVLVFLQNLQIKTTDLGSNSNCVKVQYSQRVYILNSNLSANGDTYARMVHILQLSNVFLNTVTITGGYSGIATIYGGKATAYYVHAGDTQPKYALWAYGGHIIKTYGTDITGSVADTYEGGGGRVWT